MRSRTIAITNQKGGSGKTTTTVNLAAALGEQGRRVLVVDLDPQASASLWLGAGDGSGGLYEVFSGNGELESLVQPASAPGVDVVAGTARLADLERNGANPHQGETVLRRKLAGLKPGAWDYVLIDCPPMLGMLTTNALAAARELIVPVEAHVMALQGLARLVETVDAMKARVNPDLTLTGIVACRVRGGVLHPREVVQQLRTRFGKVVYNVVIRENVRLAESPSFGQPITLYDTRSAGAADYRALAREVLQQERSR